MNIIYTINGEGMGHASRSSVVIDHLLAQGHTVKIFSAGERPLVFLKKKFRSVAAVMGLHMVYRDNKVYRFRTTMRVLGQTPQLRKDIALIKEAVTSFHPDVVITDFDFHGQIAASLAHVPLISIDNIQYITQARFSVPAEDFLNYELNYIVAKMMVPHADYYFITALDTPIIKHTEKKEKVFFVPPLLRDTVLNTPATPGSHILVYQTYDMYDRLLPILEQSSEQYIIYNAHQKSAFGNIETKEFSEEVFIKDLASAKAVITNGGFNVITEAVYYHKPVLSIPIRNHFEQQLNASIVERLGLGIAIKRISLRTLNNFTDRIESFQSPASRIVFDNSILFQKLDRVLVEVSHKK